MMRTIRLLVNQHPIPGEQYLRIEAHNNQLIVTGHVTNEKTLLQLLDITTSDSFEIQTNEQDLLLKPLKEVELVIESDFKDIVRYRLVLVGKKGDLLIKTLISKINRAHGEAGET